MFKKLLILFLLFAAIPTHGQGLVSGGNSRATVTNGGLDVNIQDQHTRALDLRFIKALAPPTVLSVASIVDGNTVTLANASGFVDGSYVLIAEADDRFYLGTQLGAAVGNVITLDTPIDLVYPVGTTVLNTSYAMNVDGSVTPQIFQVGSSGSVAEIDITRVIGFLQDDLEMDDSTFGGLPALTNGCVLRLSDGENQNLWNVKSNGDLSLIGYDFAYAEKAKFGSYGARFRVTYAGQGKHGVTLRLSPGETLEFIIQDDLTGLEVFNMMAQGHVVE